MRESRQEDGGSNPSYLRPQCKQLGVFKPKGAPVYDKGLDFNNPKVCDEYKKMKMEELEAESLECSKMETQAKCIAYKIRQAIK